MPETLMPRTNINGDFDGMWLLYRASLRYCWAPAALLALLWAGLLGILLSRLVAQDDVFLLISQTEELVASGAFWRVVTAACCVSTLLFCMIIAIVHAVAIGAPIGLATAFGRALRSFPGAMAGTVVYLTITTVGTLFFIVPGAWLWGIWQLWPVTMIVEGAGPASSLGRSRVLMRGVWWSGTTVTAVATTAAVAIPLVCNAVAAALAALAGADAAQVQYVALLALGISAAFTAPWLPAALVAVYLAQLRAGASQV
jgi:hypothetical protein